MLPLFRTKNQEDRSPQVKNQTMELVLTKEELQLEDPRMTGKISILDLLKKVTLWNQVSKSFLKCLKRDWQTSQYSELNLSLGALNGRMWISPMLILMWLTFQKIHVKYTMIPKIPNLKRVKSSTERRLLLLRCLKMYLLAILKKWRIF